MTRTFRLTFRVVTIALLCLATLAASAKPPATLTVWDGKIPGVGLGWAEPKPASIQATADPSAPGKMAVVVTPSPAVNWFACGWRWFPWATVTGTDTTAYKSLVFRIKIVSTSGSPPEIKVWLRSGQHDASAMPDIKPYESARGQWSEVTIPLTAFAGGQKAFNPKGVNELDLTGSPTAGQTISVADIGLTNK